MSLRTLTGFLLLLPAFAMAELEVVIIEGLGGEGRYTQKFADQVDAVEAASGALTTSDRINVFRAN